MKQAVPHRRRRGSGKRGVTLIELIVSMGVFALLLGILLVTTQGVQRIWISSFQKVDSMQTGRAVLELMSRELTGALVSDRFQLVQTPRLTGLVTTPPAVAANSSSLFWIAPVDTPSRTRPGATSTSLCEIGYYLTRDDAAGIYRLNRFLLAPDSPWYQAGTTAPAWNTTPWLSACDPSLFDPESTNCAVSTVADGVVGMWIRCLDTAGNPIPFLSAAPGLAGATPMQFNSAAPFQMAGRDGAFSSGDTFQYLTASAQPAHRLPGSIEITLVLVDSRTLARKPMLPTMPPPTTAVDIPDQIREFQAELAEARIPAETLVVRVPLTNALP
ncbi:hypothetical protein DB346_00930 [Verrucomicrobia bacterium LW23]|nr:hypothetical protein DB346_00930 [Verrucomicrobia bacterium LW23]